MAFFSPQQLDTEKQMDRTHGSVASASTLCSQSDNNTATLQIYVGFHLVPHTDNY